ncbi:MAG: hypothetical protein AB7V77_03510 [Candidatus Woesearchaeota archaeon]
MSLNNLIPNLIPRENKDSKRNIVDSTRYQGEYKFLNEIVQKVWDKTSDIEVLHNINHIFDKYVSSEIKDDTFVYHIAEIANKGEKELLKKVTSLIAKTMDKPEDLEEVTNALVIAYDTYKGDIKVSSDVTDTLLAYAGTESLKYVADGIFWIADAMSDKQIISKIVNELKDDVPQYKESFPNGIFYDLEQKYKPEIENFEEIAVNLNVGDYRLMHKAWKRSDYDFTDAVNEASSIPEKVKVIRNWESNYK